MGYRFGEIVKEHGSSFFQPQPLNELEEGLPGKGMKDPVEMVF